MEALPPLEVGVTVMVGLAVATGFAVAVLAALAMLSLIGGVAVPLSFALASVTLQMARAAKPKRRHTKPKHC